MPELKRRSESRWDGDIKNKTKNCDECEFKIKFHNREICSWGRAFKYVVGEGTRKCEYFKKEPPENNSHEYVVEAVRENRLGKSKYYKNQGGIQLKIWGY